MARTSPRWLLLALPLAACHSAPVKVAELAPPRLLVHNFAGSPLAGVVAQEFAVAAAPAAADRPQPARSLQLEVVLAAVPPEVTGEPLALHCALITTDGTAMPLAAYPLQLAGVRVAEPPLTAGATLASATAPLPSGETTVVDLVAADGTASGAPRCLVARVADRDEVRVALARAGEQVLLAPAPTLTGTALGLIVAGDDGRAFWLQLRLLAVADGPAPVRVAADAAAAGAIAAPDAAMLERRAQARLLHSLVNAEDRRFALFGLAQQYGAERCLDFLLCADAAALARLAAAVPREAGGAVDRLLLERACLAALLEPLERDEIAPEQLAFLLRTCGSVGASAVTLQEVLEGASTCERLGELLVAENLAFLHESDPTARVLAFDWLRTQGCAPAGYDPLGPLAARRRALARSEQQAAAGR